MQSEKRKPYLGSKQSLRDYTTTYFDRVYNYLRILPNEPMPSSFPILPSECCFRCKTPYMINSILWCKECEIRLFKENFGNWTSGIEGLDEFIKRTQLTTSREGDYLKFIPFNEFDNNILLEEGGFSKVYLASWNNGPCFGTIKGWMNEMEKHHDEFIWKLVYEEAPSYVREFGVKNVRDSTQNLPCIKKKSEGWAKVVKIFGLRHNKKRLSPSQPNDLKLWHDRVLDRLEIEILKRNFSCGKSTTGSQYVALKQLKNSKNVGIEFVHQLESSFTIINSSKSPKLYGISQDPETNDYILVMQYANGGDLRQYLRDNFVEIDWIQKISMLLDVAKGLKDIHDHGCAHLGIHDGNILLNLSKSFLEEESESSQEYDILISDFGMCTPANEFSNSSSHQKRYGLIPFTSPEILFNSNNDELYTTASDIYSFAMIMWELTSGQPPFVHLAHDEDLIEKIIDGLRPEITKGTPKFYLDLMEECWNHFPFKRPNIDEIIKVIESWNLKPDLIAKAEMERQEMIKSDYLILLNNYKPHPKACYYSRILNN